MARRTFAYRADFAGLVTFREEVQAAMPEPSQPADGRDAPAEEEEADDPMPPETEHVLWDLLVGDPAPDGESA